MTQKELEAAINRIVKQLDDINLLYIKKVAAQIKKIGELSQSSVNRLLAMAEMNADIAEINHKLQTAAGVTSAELTQLYKDVLQDTYTDKRFSAFLSSHPLPDETKTRLNNLVTAVSRQTMQAMYNYSNTTAVSEPYQAAIDKAVLAVASGVSDYNSVMRDTIQALGSAGLQVQYQSGYHRRLDTAVRQNVLDATKQIAQQASLTIGESLGYDAIEISAHLHSAPDHEPVQGRVFLLSEFDKMQAGLDFVDVDGNRYAGFRRPIMEWNCMHMVMSFSTKHSVRSYTDEQLNSWREANQKGCEVNGKHISTYAASQLMRQIETAIRRQKDVAVAAQAAGDDKLRLDCQRKINALSARYSAVAQAAGLSQSRNRMTVPGFKPIKAS